MSSAKNVIESNELGTLPRWDLTDLYPSPDSEELKADIEKVRSLSKEFAKAYEGKLASLSAVDFGTALKEYEGIDELLSKIMSFAGLKHAEKIDDPKIAQFYQSCQEQITDISTVLLFFTLELNKVDQSTLDGFLKNEAVAHYASWIQGVRDFAAHQLDDEMEKLLHEKRVSGKAAWMRLFDETFAYLRFPYDGKELASQELLEKLSDADRSVREKAAKAFADVLGKNIQLFGLITNTLAKDKATEDKWRNYESPLAARNLVNQVEDDVVQALVTAVKNAYPKLSHRYYALKAKWMGLDEMEYWDRNAPLAEEDNSKIKYNDAVDTVLDAYKAFSPEIGEVATKFFDNDWIDVPMVPGKSPGAFAHSCVPSVHPYLLLNYQGRTRDVMTLAHELGHGVHQYLAAKKQGHLLSDTPLTLAETASVFGEMLTFQSMLKTTTDPKKRKVMLAKKVEDMLNTVVRQISFHQFEWEVHTRRQQGELTADEISEIWLNIAKESLGPIFNYRDEYKYFWAYIPHFIHSPFYVYAYAFGDCLVNSLYAVYQNSDEGFTEKYWEMLAAGGSKRHKELLAPFGLDASNPDFWSKGLEMISGFIDELETLE